MDDAIRFTSDDLARTAAAVARIAALPGVPSGSWCEAAALALSRTHAPAAVAVFRYSDGRFSSAGARWSGRAGGGAPSGRLPKSDAGALARRVGDAFAGRPKGALARAEPLAQDPAGFSVCALIGLAPGGDGSWLAVERTARAMADAVKAACTLDAVLPHLAARARLAFADADRAPGEAITPSEQQVLERLVHGLSIREIAAELSRSPHTVHDHIKRLHRKLNATSRGQLVARALGHPPGTA